jgi:trimeric autotransporter adhesin
MRRFLTLVCLLFLAIPAGITITGCYRNPAGNYCNGLGYGPKDTDLYTITLQPQHTGVSLAFGQTRQINAPQAASCKGTSVSVGSYTYGTTNNQLVDITPTGNMCAGTWNRNSGGGIADFTICNPPSPTPSSNGQPFSTAFITATAQAVTSNPVEVYVHAPVTSITLVGPQQCLSQTEVAQLDAQACYVANGKQVLMCAPSTVTAANYACPLPAGVTSVPNCNASIGTLSYNAGSSNIASINAETNQITAEMPGTTVITASVAGSGSSAGYFSTCPPAAISISLNGKTTGTVTQGVTQNLVTNVTDTHGHAITGLTLDYQSTNPLDVSAATTGSINANFPGSASLYAVCQPATCNPAPINQIGVNGTGLSISSNPVDVTVPGTASAFMWFGAPGQSQYYVPVELLSGTVGSTVRLPFVPNSMIMDRTGTSLYFGSSHELMVYSTSSNIKSGEFPSLPGVVLAVSPTNSQVLVNDQVRQVFYLANSNGSIIGTFGGMGTAAQWTPDGKTLYVTDSVAAGTGHTNTLYVYNSNTGWTANPLTTSAGTTGPQNLAISIPGVGAYLSGDPTVAHTWCPSGNAGNYASMSFYPEGDSVNADTSVLTATTDGMQILGAAALGLGGASGPISFSDIGVTIPTSTACPTDSTTGALKPLTIAHTLNQTTVNVNATQVNAVVTSPAAVNQGANTAANSLSFILYNGTATGATLPYYQQTTGSTSSLGTVGYLTLTGSSSITAPLAGAFSADSTLFFVSTAGDNKVHYINTGTLQDTQQISPNLPACTPGADPGCKVTSPAPTVVPATAIWVKPRATT